MDTHLTIQEQQNHLLVSNIQRKKQQTSFVDNRSFSVLQAKLIENISQSPVQFNPRPLLPPPFVWRSLNTDHFAENVVDINDSPVNKPCLNKASVVAYATEKYNDGDFYSFSSPQYPNSMIYDLDCYSIRPNGRHGNRWCIIYHLTYDRALGHIKLITHYGPLS